LVGGWGIAGEALGRHAERESVGQIILACTARANPIDIIDVFESHYWLDALNPDCATFNT